MSRSTSPARVSAEAVALYAWLEQAPVPAWIRVGTVADNGAGLEARFAGAGVMCAPIWESRGRKEAIGVVRFGVQIANGVREFLRKPITAEAWRVSQRIARALAERAEHVAVFGE